MKLKWIVKKNKKKKVVAFGCFASCEKMRNAG